MGNKGLKKEQKTAQPVNETFIIEKIRKAISIMHKREGYLEQRIEKLRNNAFFNYRRANEKKATREARKMKMYEKQLIRIQAKKLNMETRIIALEGAQMNKTNVPVSIPGRIEHPRRNDVNEDPDMIVNAPEIAEMNEINEALSVLAPPESDMDDLEEELQELVAECERFEVAVIEEFKAIDEFKGVVIAPFYILVFAFIFGREYLLERRTSPLEGKAQPSNDVDADLAELEAMLL